MAYTKEQLEAQRETLRRHLDLVEKELGGGEGNGGGDVTATVEKRDQDAALWERLSPAEKMNMYETNRERWNAIKDAYEAEGMRKLFHKGSVP